ncbi:hypothetical protein D5018_12940 [Parashewanella curva]|uniref:Serine/threonine protein kinase n=1 Tax=Parashewanella curva TaxID=2338552 RepID=A0A3L8PV23_9GAMM|nr:hypothetical protein [Parashewanella curva]RLV59251.1 hypothetical protein D5018_12940 [Parashewanella curva]
MIESINRRIYRTGKMYVEINQHNVIKRFLPQRDSLKRFKLEIYALKQLVDFKRVPKLINVNKNEMSFEMSRLPGIKPTCLSQSHIKQLKGIVNQLLSHGIARHALPLRDLLVDEKGKLYMVDFERITICRFKFSPVWLIAKAVTHSHVLRLIGQFQPQMLTRFQKIELISLLGLRQIFQIIKKPINILKEKLFRR